ncbi:MAG: hypothetical protein AAGD88_04410 [Bacteroidota bacterium]
MGGLKPIVAVALFLWVSFGIAQKSFPKGVVIDSVPIAQNAKESFTLYLPSSFEPNNPSSIIFIFDPAARSKIGIRPFIKASEKYGHILVCSKNSKNGPHEQNFGIANRLFSHVFSNFSIKADEMYLAGFSGGSRLASSIATLTDRFAGVIACGAGFSGGAGHRPSFQDFDYVGLCGDEDFNFREMFENQNYLDIMNFDQTLLTFSGGHGWPASDDIIRACDWLFVQFEKKKDSPDKAMLNTLFEEEKIRISDLNNNILLKAQAYERVILLFRSVFDVQKLEQEYEKITHSKEYKNASKLQNTILKQEGALISRFVKRWQVDLMNPTNANYAWWEKEFDKLTQKRGSEDTRKMVRRIVSNIGALTYERFYGDTNTPPQEEYLQNLLSLLPKGPGRIN